MRRLIVVVILCIVAACVARVKPAPIQGNYQMVTPAWTVICDKRQLVYFRDRVRFTRMQRCWQE